MSDSQPSSPLVQLDDIGKSYGGVHALNGVSFAIERGSVHALAGENGAGKSTLVKVLTGVVRPDRGTIRVYGAPVRISDPGVARDLGIVAMYQDPTVFPDLTVAESAFAGRQPGRAGFVDWRRMRVELDAVLTTLGAEFTASMPARGLGIADRQLLEIAKALLVDARLVIMDEPTASLSPREVDRLFAIVRRLQAQGIAILLITHRLHEIETLADRVTVLRDGTHVVTADTTDLSQDELVRLMVGRSVESMFSAREVQAAEVVLRVDGLTRRGVFYDISFDVRRGEILGMAGFVGAGRTEVARAIAGLDHYEAGEIRVGSEVVHAHTPRAALRHGIAYVPEDRVELGLISEMSVASNTSMAVLPKLTPGGFLRPRREAELTERMIDRLSIKTRSSRAPVRSLSGGNQQKVVLAKWLAVDPSVLLLDEPTHGIDVGAKADVHEMIAELAASGLAVVLISSDLTEILALSDRVVVMREGRLVAELSSERATEETVVAAAAGVVEVAR